MQQINCMNMSKEQLLNFIDKVSFAVIDINLYLDTHPMDKCAMEYLMTNSRLRRMAMEAYSKKFGPLSMDFIVTDICSNNGGEC